MKQLKKTILTLVALLAMTAGAWAESKPIGLNVEYAAGDEITSTTDVYVYYGEQPGTLKKMGVKITSTQPLKIFMIHAHGFELNGDAAVYYLPDGVATGGYAGGISCFGESTGDATVVHVASGSGTLTDPYVFGFGPFGTPVPLTQGTGEKINEWTLTNGMPAGNVTVNVKYFAQAEFAMSTGTTPVALAPAAIADVPANTDDPIVTAGTVANIGTSEVKQGTLMYFVKQSTGNTAPDAPGYNTEGWSENVPTANGLAEGNAYVWYYIKGAEPANIADRTDDNTRSDSDIKALGTTGIVTIAAEPTYDVSLNKTDLADGEPALWKAKSTNVAEVNLGEADLKGVKKSETVTVTYTGTKKVLGVKAEKKKVAEGHALTSAKFGEIVCSDGKAYAAADKDNLPKGVKAEALVCYVNGEHGLALAMADVKNEKMSWDNDRGANDGKTAAEWCAGWNTSHPIAGATWLLASQEQWNNMISAAGSASNLSNAFSAVGGTNLQAYSYWSSTPNHGGSAAWFYYFPSSSWQWTYLNQDNTGRYIRACLAF